MKNAQAIHEKALRITKDYLRAESELISIFQEMDQCQGYLDLGYRSLSAYAISLGLSESVAFNLITVARKALEVPRLQTLVEEGALTLSNARTIAPVLTPQNQDKWLQAATVLSKRELESAIASESELVPMKDISLKIPAELYEKFKRAQEVESSKQQKHLSLEETLKAMLEVYLDRKDPVRVAERVLHKKNKQSPVPGRERPQKEGRFIPADLKHRVMLRDRGQCTALESGKRCPERKWLHLHHKKPISNEGKSTLENLTMLCASHHRLHHRFE